MTDIAGVLAADTPVMPPTRSGWQRVLPSPIVTACLVAWIVTALLGYGIVRLWNVNPLTVQGVTMPLSIGTGGALILTGLAWRFRSDWIIGIGAGAYAGWATTTVAAALNGTPYGYGNLIGDAGRMSALVTHFTKTWHNTDASDPSLPSEYPPLYPMLVGRVAAILGRPGWTMLGKAQEVLIGAVVVAAFVLWLRLVHPALALAIAVVFPPALAEPSKVNEILALVVLIPTLLGTFVPPRTGKRLNPVVAGVITGLMVPWFPNLLIVSIFGVIAVICYGWWRSAERRSYLVRVAITVGVAFVLASWYIIPLVHGYLTGHPEVVADQYLTSSLAVDPLRLFTTSMDLFNVLSVIGIVGTVLLIRRAWWAPPLTLFLVGTQVFRVVLLARLTSTGHAFVLFYSRYLATYTTMVAGLLVVSRLIVWLMRRAQSWERGATLALRPTVVVAVAAFVSVAGFTAWTMWAPSPRGLNNRVTDTTGSGRNLATLAHAELLPDGRRVKMSTHVTSHEFPTNKVIDTVRATLGKNANPIVLCYDQRLFAFEPWRDWLPPSRTSSNALVRWDTRFALLQRLSTITDPVAFAEATDHTEFGAIDVFVLRSGGSYWTSTDGIHFQLNQFSDPSFVITRLTPTLLIVVRR